MFYLGTNRYELARKLATKPPPLGVHKWPFCLLPPWTMGLEFLDNCRFGVRDGAAEVAAAPFGPEGLCI